MVLIKEICTDDSLSPSEDEALLEEDEEENSPDPPVLPLTPENPVPATPSQGQIPGASSEVASNLFLPSRSAFIPIPTVRSTVWSQYRVPPSAVINRFFDNIHTPNIIEQEDMEPPEWNFSPGLENNNDDFLPCFTFTASEPRAPEVEANDNRRQGIIENSPTVEEQITSEPTTTILEHQTESDGSAKEKSDGFSEKDLKAAAATGAGPRLFSSPEITGDELSETTECASSPEYEKIQNQIYATSSFIDCPSTSSGKHLDPYMGRASNDSETSDDGEAAALPSTSLKDSRNTNEVDDDSLFLYEESEIPMPSTSAAVPNPDFERRNMKQENRRRARRWVRTARIQKRVIFVPTEKIGRIIGKGGARIKEIEIKSGAKITVVNRKSARSVTQITLTGTEEQIAAADEEICTTARNYKPAQPGERTTASRSVDEEELKRVVESIKQQLLDAEDLSRQNKP